MGAPGGGASAVQNITTFVRHITYPLHSHASAVFQGSTPFLHASSILRTLGLKHTALFNVCALATLLTFTLLRIVMQPLCMVSLYHSHHLWAAANQSTLWLILLLIGCGFCLLNFVWWSMLMRKAYTALFGGGEESKWRGEAPAPERGSGRDGKGGKGQ